MTAAEPGPTADPANSAGPGRVDSAEIDALFAVHRDRSGAAAAEVRDEIISRALPLARGIARRFSGRGEDFDDLYQVACVGLIKAIDRFDPGLGHEFVSFAVPTVMGEVRRHFRDHAWSAHVPRRLKDLTVSIGKVTDPLAQRLGRSATAAEIAAEIGAEPTEVIEALAARNAYQPTSLDSPLGSVDDEGAGTLADTLGEDDAELARSEDYLALRPVLDELPPRERRILVLRFFKEMSQSDIAREIGVSQVHVSRLLARTLAEIRARMAD